MKPSIDRTAARTAALTMVCVSLAAAGFARQADAQAVQTPKTGKPPFVMTGNSFRQEGVVNHARGNVVVRTDALEILADEVVFNAATGELDARGNVIVTPAAKQNPATPPAASGTVQDTPARPGLAQELETARAVLARATDLYSKGLVSRAEVERAEAEVKRLTVEAARELADKGLAPRSDTLRTPATESGTPKPAGNGWTIQTDALKLRLPV